MIRIVAPLLAVLLPWLALATPAAAAPIYDIQTFTIPGATSFTAEAINNGGQIVGTLHRPDFHQAGFIYTIATGAITTFTGPPGRFGIGTTATGINDAGTVFGYSDSFGYYLRDAGGTFTSVATPPLNDFSATRLNNAGQVLGRYEPSGVTPRPDPFSAEGVLLDTHTGNVTIIDAKPTAIGTFANGLNNLGQVVGNIFDFTPSLFVSQSFVYDSATNAATILNIPKSSTSNSLFAINDVGQAIGAYSDPLGGSVYFLLDLATQTYTTLPFAAEGINNAGQIFGLLFDSNGLPFGDAIVATPRATVPEPPAIWLLFPVLLAACTYRRLKHP